MFVELDELDAGRAAEADLCLVGAGAAGITLAREFLGTACRVLLVESGGVTPDADTADLYRSEMSPGGKVHRGVHEGRARVFGGTTTLWGGQALPLSTLDFERRPWVSESGWPFETHELEPYHDRARDILGLGNTAFDSDIHQMFGLHRPDLDAGVVQYVYSQWSPHPNFGVTYHKAIRDAENICVLLNANVTQILLSQSGSQVVGLEIKRFGGPARVVRAKAYVICCGGMETPRLLLASNRIQQEGLGNRHDLVGRYFQDHLFVRWGDFTPNQKVRSDEVFNAFYRNGLKYYPLIAAAEEFQRGHEILNISAAVLFDNGPDSGVEVAKRVYRAVQTRKLREMRVSDPTLLIRRLPEIVRSCYRVLCEGRSYVSPGAPLYLGSTVEQEPNSSSRLYLSSSVDKLGMPRLMVDWRPTSLSRKTLASFAAAIRFEFERSNLGRVNPYPWVLEEDDQWLENVQDNFHHMGATRMHADPCRGVVDANCRVHGVDNLYVASSSVFPTGGHSNPTFTLLLLCFRLADLLKTCLL